MAKPIKETPIQFGKDTENRLMYFELIQLKED